MRRSAYTHASMKDTLADLGGLKVDGSGGLLDLINTVVDNTFLSEPWVQGVSQLDSDPHPYPAAPLGKVASISPPETLPRLLR